MPTYNCGCGCSISCPNGGGCMRWEDGSCDAFCNGDSWTPKKKQIAPKDIIANIKINDMSASEVIATLGSLFSRSDVARLEIYLEKSNKLSVSLTNVTISQVIDALVSKLSA